MTIHLDNCLLLENRESSKANRDIINLSWTLLNSVTYIQHFNTCSLLTNSEHFKASVVTRKLVHLITDTLFCTLTILC